MQSAFRLGETGPSARSRIFSRPHGARAVRAADAWIVLVVKLVVWNIMIMDVAPHLFRAPVNNGIYFYETEFGVPFNTPRAGPN